MTRQEKIEMLKRIEAGADMFNELHKDQVIVCVDGRCSLNGKEMTEEQVNNFKGIVLHIEKHVTKGDFDNA